jgi:cytochrome c oxidase assembly protein Cox11
MEPQAPHETPAPQPDAAPSQESRERELARRNRRTGLMLVGVLAAMAVFPWTYAPIYRKVCGALGIPTTSDKPFEVLLKTARHGVGAERKDKSKVSLVNFMGVSGELPIDITPLQRRAWVRTGDMYAVTYRLTNLTDRDLDYRAVHMVVPEKNESFELIKCFCEEHRIIKAHETQELPLTFRLVKPVEGDAGLTVNYTIFNYDRKANEAPTKLSAR